MKIFASIILLLVCCTQGKAQTVFAPANAIWHYGHIDSDGGMTYTVHQTEKDTLFEGHWCSKINTRKYYTSSSFIQEPDQYTYTSSDTVFYYNSTFNQFFPLYVFDVHQGDTLKLHVPFYLSADDSFRIVIDSVYYINIDGLSLKTIKTSYLDDFSLFTYSERVGSMRSFNGHIGISGLTSSSYIRCYQDGMIDTNFKAEACDYLEPSKIDSKIVDQSIQVFPNPFSDYIHIRKPHTIPQLKLELYNSIGQKEWSINIEDQEETDISSVNLSPGIYFIRVSTTDSGLHNTRIILKQ